MAMVLGKFAPSIEQIYYKMEQIEYHLHDETYSILTRAFDTHFDIIMTQPYSDYNKRTARLVMNWFLMQNGYRPIIFNKKKQMQRHTQMPCTPESMATVAHTQTTWNQVCYTHNNKL